MPRVSRNERKTEQKDENRKERTLAQISVTVWLTPENAGFFMKNGFLYIRINGEEQRARLRRQFPFELLWEFISVLSEDEEEIGIIRRIDLFSGDDRELIETELNRQYYSPKIRSIISMKERHGFSMWQVATDDGEISFTLHDTYKSLLRVGECRVMLLDVDGNRFEIPDVNKLDRKSYKKIELYL